MAINVNPATGPFQSPTTDQQMHHDTATGDGGVGHVELVIQWGRQGYLRTRLLTAQTSAQGQGSQQGQERHDLSFRAMLVVKPASPHIRARNGVMPQTRSL